MDPYATHQEFLSAYILATSGDIVEFGTGDGSTGLILDLIKNTGRKLVSFENDKQWFDKMISLYPPSDNHEYVFVSDWQHAISNLDSSAFDVVFIDQNPWEARLMSMKHFQYSDSYIIIHDVDYFPRNKLFGHMISLFEFDFSSDFSKSRVYYPKGNWPSPTGPPTLVATNSSSKHLLDI